MKHPMNINKTMRILSFLFGVGSMLCAQIVIAQPTDRFKVAGTSSPRDTLRSFIEATNELHEILQETRVVDRNSHEYHALGVRILDCIDASELPAFAREQRAGQAAAALKEILDRVELPPWEEIPDVQEIEAAGGY
jgi:hypothetical protein